MLACCLVNDFWGPISRGIRDGHSLVTVFRIVQGCLLLWGKYHVRLVGIGGKALICWDRAMEGVIFFYRDLKDFAIELYFLDLRLWLTWKREIENEGGREKERGRERELGRVNVGRERERKSDNDRKVVTNL